MNPNEVFTGEFHTSLKCKYTIPRKAANFDAAAPLIESADVNVINTPNFINDASVAIPSDPTPSPQDTDRDSNKNPIGRKRSRFTLPNTEGLPVDLSKLFLPLCCDLCSTKLNSPISAKMHYESKNHEKKINAWLTEWCARTGEPMPKRQSVHPKGPIGPNALHCEICDLPLTSLQHANQHYMGKKHRQVLAGIGKPSGPGYYGPNNEWIRTEKPKVDPTNRFFIGESFLRQQIEEQNQITVPTVAITTTDAPLPPPPPLPQLVDSEKSSSVNSSSTDLTSTNEASSTASVSPQRPANIDPNKYCSICNISVTAEMHMRLHLNGTKHAKKLRQLGQPPYVENPDMLVQSIMHSPQSSGDERVNKNSGNGNDAALKVDFSVYRTPSGQYYCQTCDVAVISESLLSQHFTSKKHIKMAKRK